MLLLQGGLDGRSGVSNSCRWVVRVVVEVFNQFSGLVSLSPCDLEDEWDQVDAEVSVELFLFFAFGHVAWTTTGGRYEASVGGKGGDNGRINKVRAAMWVKDDIHAFSFCLSRLGGLCEPWDEVRKASGMCGVPLVNPTPLLQVIQCSWWASMGQAHVRLAALMLGRVGEMLAELLAA